MRQHTIRRGGYGTGPGPLRTSPPGRRVKLEKKPMELLIFLVGRREQLVSRKEIVAKLWRSDLFIDTEANINNIVRKIRTALGDDSTKPRFLETVVGKGYRFVGPVRVIDARYPQSDFGPRASARGQPRKDAWVERALVVGRVAADSFSGRSRMTMGYAWDLPMLWSRGWEICRAWTSCQLQRC